MRDSVRARAATLDGVLRLVLSPRWLLWHLLTLGAMVTCGWLAAWQWQRAGSAMGSALNVGYGLQWPLFAVFFGVMWWRFLRLEIRQQRAADPAGARAPVAGSARGSARRTARGSARGPVPPLTEPLHAGPSPFGPRPADARPAPIEEDSALAEYNRMLAALAARNREPHHESED